MLTGPEVRRRREAIGLSRQALASRAGVSISALQAFEVAEADARRSTIEAIERALDEAEDEQEARK